MKAQCERCKEIVPLEFTIGEGGIEVTCPACSQSYFVSGGPGPAAEPSKPKPAPVPMPLPANLPPAPPGAAEAFDACAAKWDDDAPHDAFLALCRAEGAFSYAAARYRAAAADPARADRANARLKQIRSQAEQALYAAARAEKPLPRGQTVRWVAGAVFIALLLALGAYLYFRRH